MQTIIEDFRDKEILKIVALKQDLQRCFKAISHNKIFNL